MGRRSAGKRPITGLARSLNEKGFAKKTNTEFRRMINLRMRLDGVELFYDKT